jgi:hypothetical protein
MTCFEACRRVPVVIALAAGSGCGGSVETAEDGAGGASSAAGPVTTATAGGSDSSSATATTSATAASTSATSASTSSGSGCDAPLDDATLQELQLTGNGLGILLGGRATAHPGDTVDFELGIFECCYFFEPVDACATFSIAPAEGADIDPATGAVRVDGSTPHGATFTVTADVEEGRRLLTADLYVWTTEGNPIVGTYSEQAQLACGGGEREPEQPLGEVAFYGDERFAVTWTPFEVYVDYWGTYTIDPGAQTLELTVEGGNYVPPDVDPSGTFRLEGEQLILEDMYLGSPQGGVAAPACGHVLQ